MAPKQQPGRSKQNYRTPPKFLAAVRKRLGIETFAIDLAADHENSVAPFFFDEAKDSLKQPWAAIPGMSYGPSTWLWCNPPYAHIEPWVKKAYYESMCGCNVAMLLPAGVGSNWWRDHVHDRCQVLLLNGRISFDGKAPYPKDCVLLLYGEKIVDGYDVWDWE